MTINASGIFGTEPRTEPSLESDITAFGRSAELNGIVQINTPDIDPSQGLVELSTSISDASEQIDTGCTTADSDINQFVITGRGGLPPRPEEPLNGDAVWSDTRVPKVTPQQPSSEKPQNQPASQSNSTSIIPATGWVFNNQGEVTLISHASYTTDLGSTSANCSRKQS